MTRLMLATATCALLAGPAAAWDFEMRGAELTGSGYYGTQPGSTWWVARLGGSAEVGLADGAFLQFDAVGQNYAFTPGPTVLGISGGVHLGYDINSDTQIGAFAMYNAWDTWADSYTLGAEARADFGDVTVEGFVAHMRGAGGAWWTNHADIELQYAFDDHWGAGIGGAYMTSSFGTNMFQAKANLRYALADDSFLEANYTYSNHSALGASHAIGISFTKVFGGGTSFARRDYANIYNGW